VKLLGTFEPSTDICTTFPIYSTVHPKDSRALHTGFRVLQGTTFELSPRLKTMRRTNANFRDHEHIGFLNFHKNSGRAGSRSVNSTCVRRRASTSGLIKGEIYCVKTQAMRWSHPPARSLWVDRRRMNRSDICLPCGAMRRHR
jgi:hypothetical protein